MVRSKSKRRVGPLSPFFQLVAKDQLYWLLCKELGDEGEAAVFRYFKKAGWPYKRFKVPDAISKTRFPDERERAEFTTQFKKDLLIDALARIDELPYAVEIKTKQDPFFVVDVEHYDPLYELSKIIAVRVYFYIKAREEIYLHKVRDPQRLDAFHRRPIRGEEVYDIPEGELELVAEVREGGESRGISRATSR